MDTPFKHLLVATDGSLLADEAVKLALRLGASTRVTCLIVAHDYGLVEYARAALDHRPDAQELRREIAADARRELEEALARAARHGLRIDGVERRVVISSRAPCHEIVEVAEQQGCDLIVMASHGIGGRMAAILGSQAQAVLSAAKVPVLIAR
jgi:nucleotide-binding universal stress UspA family protein